MRRILLISVLCSLAACQRDSTKGVKADATLVKYLPSDVTLLAGANVKALTGSALYKRHQGEFHFNRGAEFGVDPEKDLSQALMTWVDSHLVVLAEGNFSKLKPSAGVTRPEPNVLVASSLKIISDGHGAIPEALRKQMESLPAEDQVWIVSDRGLPLDRIPASEDVKNALSNIANDIRALSVGVGFDEGAHLRADLMCDSEAGAKRVHDAIRGVIGMARLMTRDDQMARLKLYDAVQVDQDHSVIHVKADLNANEADSAIALLRGFEKR